MFTGLVQTIGTLTRLERRGPGARLHVHCSFREYVKGESIALNGACLSVTESGLDWFAVYASSETLSLTGLEGLSSGASINLERAIRSGDPLGGHIVTGHVDTRVRIVGRAPVGDAERFTLEMPSAPLDAQIASKGSITIDGVSLTVNGVSESGFDVMIIPITLADTTLGDKRPGNFVNIETDVLAKYVARQLGRANLSSGGVDLDLLARAGFVR